MKSKRGLLLGVSLAWGGYRRYRDSKDPSRNPWLLGVLSLGEFHSNHHAFPSSAKQGHAWWEFDCGYTVVKILEAFGLARDVKVAPKTGQETGASP